MRPPSESELLTAILAEARAQVAAGRAPNLEGLEARLAAAARAGADEAAVEGARQSLQSIAAVHRARARLARDPRPAPARRAPAALRTRPTITGTLDVRRAAEGFRLEWDRVPAVEEWKVRFSERPDVRSDYVERETVVLPGETTSIEAPLGDNSLRVAIVGRGRAGRVQRRALISGLSRDGWHDRWLRRASAS